MNDALERLKKRNRPTVPSRDASLTPPALVQDTSTSKKLDMQIPIHQESQVSTKPEVTLSLQTKQSTLRLEQEVSDRLQDLARRNDLCREVLIEAMFEYCEANSEALERVLPEARTKNDLRQQVANQKRAKSMMERFG